MWRVKVLVDELVLLLCELLCRQKTKLEAPKCFYKKMVRSTPIIRKDTASRNFRENLFQMWISWYIPSFVESGVSDHSYIRVRVYTPPHSGVYRREFWQNSTPSEMAWGGATPPQKFTPQWGGAVGQGYFFPHLNGGKQRFQVSHQGPENGGKIKNFPTRVRNMVGK